MRNTNGKLLSLTAIVVAWFLLCMPSLPAFASAHAEVDRSIREQLLRIEGGEREGAEATDKLRAAPRVRVLAVLKEELLSRAEPTSATLRAIAVIEARELWAELKKLASRSERWQVFSTINHLLTGEKSSGIRAEIKKIYMTRLSDLKEAAKMAVLDGLALLKAPLSRDEFQALLEDSNLHVRIAAVRYFLSTRSSHNEKEQIERFQKIFTLKPYQARLQGMKGFLALKPKERSALKSAIKPDLCDLETKDEVKSVCRNLLAIRGTAK